MSAPRERWGGEPEWYTPRHVFRPPFLDDPEDLRLWPLMWHACEFPERPLDECCLFADTKVTTLDLRTGETSERAHEDSCTGCAAAWITQGCPIPGPLPPVPEEFASQPLRKVPA